METETEVMARLVEWVKDNYSPRKCGLNCIDSIGNYGDVFSDGMECGTSWAAYDVGRILGLELQEPREAMYI